MKIEQMLKVKKKCENEENRKFFLKVACSFAPQKIKSYTALPFLTVYDLLKTVFGETFF